jgi:hypothetical protein
VFIVILIYKQNQELGKIIEKSVEIVKNSLLTSKYNTPMMVQKSGTFLIFYKKWFMIFLEIILFNSGISYFLTTENND